MAADKPNVGAAQAAGTIAVTKQMAHCKCYNVDGAFEMFVLDPGSGTYNGPFPCSQEMCQQCNAGVVVGPQGNP